MRRMMSQLLSLGVPLAIGFISQVAISFTDAALVSRLGAPELAGTTLALSVFSLVMLMGLGVITAVSPKVAESHRAGDFQGVRGWYVQGIWLSIIVGVVSAIILLNTGSILRLVGQSDELAAIAQHYNSGAAFGVIFFFLYVNARSVTSAVGKPKPLTWIMVAAIPVNFVVGYLSIFGFATVPGLGVFGAGASSTVVRGLIVLAAISLLLRGSQFRDLSLASASPRIDFARIVDLAKVGTPIGFRLLVGEGFLPVLAFFVTQFGADATAAHVVGLRVVTLITVFAIGFSAASTTIAAWSRADNNWLALRRLRLALLAVALAYVVVVGGMIAFSFDFIVQTVFAVASEEVTSILWGLLPLILLNFLFDTVGSMYNGFLVGMQDTYLPTIVVTMSYWVFGIGLGLTLAEFTPMGFYGLWSGMLVAGVIVAVFNYLRAGRHIRVLRENAPQPVEVMAQ